MSHLRGNGFVGVIQPSLRDGSQCYYRPTFERVGYSQISLREMTLMLGLSLFAFLIPPTLAADSAMSLEPARRGITTNELMQHVRKLASDEFEGRAPGTRGEELTVNYLVDQFRKAGLKPGNPDGTFFQDVPPMGVT